MTRVPDDLSHYIFPWFQKETNIEEIRKNQYLVLLEMYHTVENSLIIHCVLNFSFEKVHISLGQGAMTH